MIPIRKTAEAGALDAPPLLPYREKSKKGFQCGQIANYGIRFLHDPADGFVQQLQVVDVHGTVHIHVGHIVEIVLVCDTTAVVLPYGQYLIQALDIAGVDRFAIGGRAVDIAALNDLRRQIEQIAVYRQVIAVETKPS